MPATPVTSDNLARLHAPNKRTELVRGELMVREPAGGRHGFIAARLCAALSQHVYAHDLGAVFAAETGFLLFTNPDTVRAPDAAFVRRARLPDPIPAGFLPFAPDLAVEVLSPDDRPGEVLAKVADWLRAGTELVWIVDPIRRIARIYRADGSESALTPDDVLSGEEAVPGFTLALTAILP